MLNKMHAFKSHESISCDQAPRDEGTLVSRNKLTQDWSEAINQTFSNHLIQYSAQADRPEIFHGCWLVTFRNKHNDSVIDPVRHYTSGKKLPDCINYLGLHYVPVSLIEACRKPVDAWGL